MVASGNSHEGKRKKSSGSSISTENEDYSPNLSSREDQYPVSISGSRAGGGTVTPSHFQQMHFMRHENEYFKQAPVIGISPNTVKVREDMAAFEAESRLKDQIIDIYKSHQTALGIEHQRTLQVADNAAQQIRSVFESSQKQFSDSELLRHQTQLLTNSQLTENHRDMFFGLGRQGCDLRSLYGNSPRRSGFSQQNTSFDYSRQVKIGAIHQPSLISIEQPHCDYIEQKSELAIQAGPSALSSGKPFRSLLEK